jgi:hypothetical protein
VLVIRRRAAVDNLADGQETLWHFGLLKKTKDVFVKRENLHELVASLPQKITASRGKWRKT